MKIMFEESLAHFDRDLELELEPCFVEISHKSKALTNSLKRCFDRARKSARFERAYELGCQGRVYTSEILTDQIVLEFKEEDILIFQEFARLLRACSLHISGAVSGKIKAAYLDTFKGQRLWLAYAAGLKGPQI